MNQFIAALATVIIPLVCFFMPGIGIATVHTKRHVLGWIVRVILWSFSLTTLITFLTAAASLPSTWAYTIIVGITAISIFVNRRRFFTMPTAWYVLAAIAAILILYTAFSIPFLLNHQGLPTGDSQKTIFWAQDIEEHHALPTYAKSLTLLNRDPVDFYTPGLHTVAAAISNISPFPLTSIGFFAIIAGIVTAIVAGGIAKEIFDLDGKIFPATLVAALILTNIRFLRYLREPGYHLQNIVGELLLFGVLYLSLSLIHRYRTKDLILAILCLAALIFTHQFSSFIAAFMLVPAGLIFLLSRRHILAQAMRKSIALSVLVCALLATIVVGGFFLGLLEKIPHIFTTNSHLVNELPSLLDYPRLLGTWWLLTGLAGTALLTIHSVRKHPHYREGIALVASIIILLALSQGPRIFIDIPPVRAMFYLVVPLSITSAYFISAVFSYVSQQPLSPKKVTLQLTMVGVLAVGLTTSLYSAYSTSSRQARTNSTLTPGLKLLIENPSLLPAGAIVTDDYGKRAGSWLLLSDRPTYSRLASDIRRPMLESQQNSTRHEMYIKQLDFEKIYSLGNWPGILTLMKKHGISTVTGVDGTSYSVFAANPALQEHAWVDTTHLFTFSSRITDSYPANIPSDKETWLLKPSTLANDIGDDEDTQDFLPASVSATRLNAVSRSQNKTYRITTAPIIPLDFNMADYSSVLWDQDGNGQPDTTLELFLTLAFPSKNLSVAENKLDNNSTTHTIKMSSESLSTNAKGHVIVNLHNPDESPVAIDMIALGLARVP